MPPPDLAAMMTTEVRPMKGLLQLALVLALALAVSASATTTPTERRQGTSGPVTALAMDGSRVVYSTDGNGVYVWNVRSGASSRVRLPTRSNAPLVREVAIAGTRVAWITRSVAGNSEETFEHLYTSASNGSGRKVLAHAFRAHEFGTDPADPDLVVQRWKGDWIGGLTGAGATLAVSRWKTEPTPDGPALERVVGGSLSLVGTTGRLTPIATGDQSIVSRAVDAGRIAVLRPDGGIGIYSRAGTLLRQLQPSSAMEIAMGGGRLVVLTRAKTLEVYDPGTGALKHIWPITTRLASRWLGHLQAYGRIGFVGIGVGYASHGARVFDLQTGKSVDLPWRPRSAWNDAAVGSLGLVHAVNDYRAYGGHRPSGTVVFLSTAHVLKGIAQGRL
jgi:hypothetical protein